jgi:O-antigen ligase
MWNAFIFVAAAISLTATLVQLRKLPDFPTRFLVFAVWFRLLLAAMHEITYQPAFGGLRINAVFSILITFAVVVLCDRRVFQIRHVQSLYVIILIIFISGLFNGQYNPMVDFVFRYAFLVGMALLAYRAFRLFDPDVVLRALVSACSLTLILQVFSIATGKYKLAEADNSISFTGGYFHESTFAQIVLIFLFSSVLIRRAPLYWYLGSVLAAFIAIYFSNYRTIIIGALPITVVVLAYAGFSLAPRRSIPYLVMGMGLAVAFLAASIDQVLPDRFRTLLDFTQHSGLLFADPASFTFEQRDILNHRVYVWAKFITAFLQADVYAWIVGSGSQSYLKFSHVFAHNTFISFLFEYGVLGLAALLYMVIYNLRIAMDVGDNRLSLMLLAGMVGFLLVNMADMALWGIEGIMAYGVLCGRAWAAHDDHAAARRGAARDAEADAPRGLLEARG